MSVIAANTDVPVSVKCRIGVDDHDSYNELCDFIYKVSSLSPTKHFIIHSRKAMLNGISPADNRRIPPLKYEYYYALLRDFPDLRFTINGGIDCVDEVNAALREGAHGVMVGRAAYNNLWNTLAHVDSAVYGEPSSGLTRRQVEEKILPSIGTHFMISLYPINFIFWVVSLIFRSLNNIKYMGMLFLGTYGNNRPNMRELIRPLSGFFYAEPGNSLWKRKADAAFLNKNIKTVKSFFEETLVVIPDAVLDSPVAELPSGRKDLFANVRGLLPPPYETRTEEVVVYAQS
uniref:Nitrogen regulation family protein n=1 Tax=Populus alba TaxID=43335 RepID=A0A4U5P5C4_POPAL|nr:nitrogen regulation family protein [Populus alba]